MKVHHLGNVNIVLTTLKDVGVRIMSDYRRVATFNVIQTIFKIRTINISANDIVEGNPKLTLGLVWYIIQHWQVRDVLRSVVSDIQTSNLEKTLLAWCQTSTKGYGP
jgi:hypothetical protein